MIDISFWKFTLSQLHLPFCFPMLVDTSVHVNTITLKLLIELVLIHIFLISFFDEDKKKIPNTWSVTQLTEFKANTRVFSRSTSFCVIQDMLFQLNVRKTSDTFCKKDLSLVQLKTSPCANTYGYFVCVMQFFFFIPGMIDELL